MQFTHIVNGKRVATPSETGRLTDLNLTYSVGEYIQSNFTWNMVDSLNEAKITYINRFEVEGVKMYCYEREDCGLELKVWWGVPTNSDLIDLNRTDTYGEDEHFTPTDTPSHMRACVKVEGKAHYYSLTLDQMPLPNWKTRWPLKVAVEWETILNFILSSIRSSFPTP